jgi:hypothetical protein
MIASDDAPRHKAGALELPDVLRRSGKRHLERFCEFGDPRRAVPEAAQHQAANWMRQCAIRQIERLDTFNHVVEHRARS